MKELNEIFSCVSELDDRTRRVAWDFLYTGESGCAPNTSKAVTVVALSSRLWFVLLRSKVRGWAG